MEFIDCHMHLDSERYKGEVDSIVAKAKNVGAVALISSGVNPSSNRAVLELSKNYGLVHCSFGLYPVDAAMSAVENLDEEFLRHIEPFDVDKELAWIEEHIANCVAIGEIGLDYKIISKEETGALQKENFRKALCLAKKYDKAVVIHSRKGEEEAIELMEEEGMKRVMMHCFSGKKKLIKRCAENGWFLSVPSVIARLDHFKMLVEIVPLENLVTETDAPYLSPVAGERNDSSTIPITIKEIARIKGVSEKEVEEILLKNAKGLFGL